MPNGVTGEICVRGTAMMRGMVGKHWYELVDRDGWLHTKDAGYRDDDGHLYFAGRTDEMIKTSGTNVAPIEVEAALGQLPEGPEWPTSSAYRTRRKARSSARRWCSTTAGRPPAEDLVTACRTQSCRVQGAEEVGDPGQTPTRCPTPPPTRSTNADWFRPNRARASWCE